MRKKEALMETKETRCAQGAYDRYHVLFINTRQRHVRNLFETIISTSNLPCGWPRLDLVQVHCFIQPSYVHHSSEERACAAG